ncbi:MAG: DUF1919 domain-containing protein [Oscillospiraceae bacterium]|nr:DUF1919 domain-containing protein [Oscillospiraceae bacterium]
MINIRNAVNNRKAFLERRRKLLANRVRLINNRNTANNRKAVNNRKAADNNKAFLERQRELLTNHDFTIFSENCVGGLISHDLGEEYRSPTVNLRIPANLFVEFMENIDYYLDAELEDVTPEGSRYPIARLGGRVALLLTRYDTFQEAKDAWERRKARVNFDNVFLIMSDYFEVNPDVISRFLALPYPKVFFSGKPIDHPDVFFMKRFEKDNKVGFLYRIGPDGLRLCWDFDIVRWLNARGKLSVRDIVSQKQQL